MKDNLAREETARETVRSMGGEIKVFYAILGAECDTTAIP